jgi:hypothetical protein
MRTSWCAPVPNRAAPARPKRNTCAHFDSARTRFTSHVSGEKRYKLGFYACSRAMQRRLFTHGARLTRTRHSRACDCAQNLHPIRSNGDALRLRSAVIDARNFFTGSGSFQ